MPAVADRRWINLDPNNPQALLAKHIYFTSGESIADRINSSVNGAMDYIYTSSNLLYTTNAFNWVDVLQLEIPLSANNKQYRINWYSEINCNDKRGYFRIIYNTNNIILGEIDRKKTKGWDIFSGFANINSKGATVKIQYKGDNNDDDNEEDEDISIRNLRMDIWRVV